MFRGLVVSAHRLLAELSQHRSPDQVAWGMALGTSFGLIPMDNLVSAFLLLAILFLPVHQLSAAAAWLVTGMCSGFLVVIPDLLGQWILSMDAVQWFVVQCHALPLGPWFRLNNTLVVGSLALGLMTLVPNWITWRLFARRTHSSFEAYLLEDMADNATAYRKSVAEPTVSVELTLPASQVRVDPPLQLASAPITVPASQGVPADVALAPEYGPPQQVTLRETFIEVVRLRSSPSPFPPTAEVKNNPMILESDTASAHVPASDPSVVRRDPSTSSAVAPFSPRCSPAHQTLSGPKTSNSLQYLLRHLATHRDAQSSSESHV